MTTAAPPRSAARSAPSAPCTSAPPPGPDMPPPAVLPPASDATPRTLGATALQACPVCDVALRPFARIDGGRLKDWFYNDRLRRLVACLHYGRCPRCGSVWAQDERRDEPLLTEIYAGLPPEYWAEMADDAAFHAGIDAMLRTFAPGPRLCDVGCGDGKLLRGLAAHWEKHGLEPGVAAAERCRADGIPTWNGTPGHLELAASGAPPKERKAEPRCAVTNPDSARAPGAACGSSTTPNRGAAPTSASQVCPTDFASPFDALTCIDVLEHVTEPRRELIGMANLLRPGGVLLLLTGDPTTRTARFAGACWEYLHWVGHVSILSRAALVTLLNATGFEILVQRTVDHASSWSLGRWTRRWLHNCARRALGRPGRRLWYCRDHQLIVARRRPEGVAP